MALQDYYNTGQTATQSVYGALWIAQTFTTNQEYYIDSVKLLFSAGAGGAGKTVTLSIKATVAGKPSGADLVSITAPADTLAALNNEWYEFVFASPILLSSGVMYAIVLSYPGVFYPANYVTCWYDHSGATYAGGTFVSSLDGGSTWSIASGADFMFETYDAGSPPVITDQSTSTDADYEDTVSFYVTATGLPAPTYQWYLDGSPLAGETNDTLVLSSVDADDGGTYYCIATNNLGSDQSDDIVLRILPYITAQSSSTSFSLGAYSSIAVTADGSPSVTYQWYKNDVAISGATSSSYSFYAASSDAGTYKCTVTNAAGSEDSDDIVITIVDNPYRSYLFNLPHDISRETS